MATGSIIMAVAVLLIHMLIRQVLSIIPQIIPLGLSPVKAKSLNAILLCKCHFSTLYASKKPPKNNKMVLLK